MLAERRAREEERKRGQRRGGRREKGGERRAEGERSKHRRGQTAAVAEMLSAAYLAASQRARAAQAAVHRGPASSPRRPGQGA